MKRIVFSIIIVGIALITTTLCGITGFYRSKNITLLNEGFELLESDDITIEYGNEFKEPGYSAIIENINLNNDVVIASNLNVNKIGTYDIFYTLNYKNLSKTLVRKVSVIDNQKPIIKILCDEELYVPTNGTIEKCDYEVTDNYDTNLKDKVLVTSNVDTSKNGDYTLTYLVNDSSNNSTTEEVIVHVRDKFELNYIRIFISTQRLEYYENNKLVFETPVTTGKNNYTKTGDFKIRNKVRDTVLRGKDYTSYVKYWMAYDGNNYGIHDASWRKNFGTMDYKTVGSHGCVNLPTNAAEQLFNMVEVGTPVYIRN